MSKRFIDYFPTMLALLDAPVFDIASAVAELIAAGDDRIIAPNCISAWTDQYERLNNEQKTTVHRAISEAWAWLHVNGIIAEDIKPGSGPNYWFITRGTEAAVRSGDLQAYAKSSLLPRELLDPDIEQVARHLFLGGHFDSAVAAAFVQVEVFIKKASGAPDELIGVKLMRHAFQPDTGPLTIPSADKGEREGAMNLFAGAIGYYKNPFSHRNVGIARAVQAASLILTANELYVTAKTHAALAERRKKESATTT